jgi:hypothetical protein
MADASADGCGEMYSVLGKYRPTEIVAFDDSVRIPMMISWVLMRRGAEAAAMYGDMVSVSIYDDGN